MAFKQIRAHFEKALFVGIKIGQFALQPIDFIQQFGHEFSLVDPDLPPKSTLLAPDTRDAVP